MTAEALPVALTVDFPPPHTTVSRRISLQFFLISLVYSRGLFNSFTVVLLIVKI